MSPSCIMSRSVLPFKFFFLATEFFMATILQNATFFKSELGALHLKHQPQGVYTGLMAGKLQSLHFVSYRKLPSPKQSC